jgi:hypothetical protein
MTFVQDSAFPVSVVDRLALVVAAIDAENGHDVAALEAARKALRPADMSLWAWFIEAAQNMGV